MKKDNLLSSEPIGIILTPGMIIELRNGVKMLINGTQAPYKAVSLDGIRFLSLEHLNEDLTHKTDNSLDVITIYPDYEASNEPFIWRRKLTQFEHDLLKSINPKFNYIARNIDGMLCVTINKPTKYKNLIWKDNVYSATDLPIINCLTFVHSYDEKPYLIKKLLEE